MLTYAIRRGEWTKVGRTIDHARVRSIVAGRCPLPQRLVEPCKDEAPELVALWEGDHEDEAHSLLIFDHPHVGEWFRGSVLPLLLERFGPSLNLATVAGGTSNTTQFFRVDPAKRNAVRARAEANRRTMLAELDLIIDAGIAALYP